MASDKTYTTRIVSRQLEEWRQILKRQEDRLEALKVLATQLKIGYVALTREIDRWATHKEEQADGS